MLRDVSPPYHRWGASPAAEKQRAFFATFTMLHKKELDMNKALTPPGCNLTDFPYMPIEIQRLMKSDTWIFGNAAERSAAMCLWLESWHQIPAASIPNSDKHLAYLSKAGEEWQKVKDHVLKGWVDGGDGRLYHPVVAEKALEAWIQKLAAAISGGRGNAMRWKIAIDTSELREQLLNTVAQLRKISPQSKLLEKKIVKTMEAEASPKSPLQSQDDRPPISTPSHEDSYSESNRNRPPMSRLSPPDPNLNPPLIAIDRDSDIERDRENKSSSVVHHRHQGDDFSPSSPNDWLTFFKQEYGIEIDTYSGHDRKKFWPLATAWAKADVTLGQMRAAIAKARADAKEPIVFLPGYADRVLASQHRSQKNYASSGETLEAYNARIIAAWVPPELRHQSPILN